MGVCGGIVGEVEEERIGGLCLGTNERCAPFCEEICGMSPWVNRFKSVAHVIYIMPKMCYSSRPSYRQGSRGNGQSRAGRDDSLVEVRDATYRLVRCDSPSVSRLRAV